MILAALATLGATVVAFVLYPVFAARGAALASPGEAEREIGDLEEKRARLLDAIADLDFEKQAGKVSDADYAAARNDYLAQIAETLTRIEGLAPGKPEKKKGAAKTPAEEASRRCETCSQSSPASAKFCIHCGGAAFALVCAGCGEKLPQEARFCMACGKKVEEAEK